MMEKENNNGHTELTDKEIDEVFDGAKASLDDLRRDDGILAKQSSNTQQGSSYLHRGVTPYDDDEYRHLLIQGVPPRRANLFIKAKSECKRTFADITEIVDQLHADAGNYGGVSRMDKGYNALTHSTYTVQNKVNNRKPRIPWYNRGNDNAGVTNYDEQ